MSQNSPLARALQRAQSLIAGGDLGGALVLLERAVELGRENLGEDHNDVLAAQRELAGVLLLVDEPVQARRTLEEAYAAGQWRLGDSDPLMLQISHDLGVIAEELGNRHEARKAFGRVAEHGPAALGVQHPLVARAQAYLGQDQNQADVRETAPAPEPRIPQQPTRPVPQVDPMSAPTTALPVLPGAGPWNGPPGQVTPSIEAPAVPIRQQAPPPAPQPAPPQVVSQPAPPPAMPQPAPPQQPQVVQPLPPPAGAQWTGAPVHEQPPTYGQPAHGQPAHGQPAYGQPPHGQPPVHEQPPATWQQPPPSAWAQTGPWQHTVEPPPANPEIWHGDDPHSRNTPGGVTIWQGGDPAPISPVQPTIVHTVTTATQPYQQNLPESGRRRGMAVFAVIAATLSAIVAVAALVFVLADRAGGPGAQPTAPPADDGTGPGVPTQNLEPPADISLDDQGAAIEVRWTDPAQGRVPFMVSMARSGQRLRPVSSVGPGETSFRMGGLNKRLNYCFAVVAVYETDRFASSDQVCTERT